MTGKESKSRITKYYHSFKYLYYSIKTKVKACWMIIRSKHYCLITLNLKSDEPAFEIIWRNFSDENIITVAKTMLNELEYKLKLETEIDELTDDKNNN